MHLQIFRDHLILKLKVNIPSYLAGTLHVGYLFTYRNPLIHLHPNTQKNPGHPLQCRLHLQNNISLHSLLQTFQRISNPNITSFQFKILP